MKRNFEDTYAMKRLINGKYKSVELRTVPVGDYFFFDGILYSYDDGTPEKYNKYYKTSGTTGTHIVMIGGVWIEYDEQGFEPHQEENTIKYEGSGRYTTSFRIMDSRVEVLVLSDEREYNTSDESW